jgi:hypothetical protein
LAAGARIGSKCSAFHHFFEISFAISKSWMTPKARN